MVSHRQKFQQNTQVYLMAEDRSRLFRRHPEKVTIFMTLYAASNIDIIFLQPSGGISALLIDH